MDRIHQIPRQNMLYSRGTQHRAHRPNEARQNFENGTQVIY